MAIFGQQHSLTLQPIYEGDIQEPSFADITDTQAIWPADSGAILHCDPKALIRIPIKSGCDDAPYRERDVDNPDWERSEEHTSELQSLMRISYAVFCLKKHKKQRHL